jgi:tripartite-type tricarboxylate transporter receptor subunit TctC
MGETVMTAVRAAFVLALVVAAPAAADEWPSRPVRMVSTFAAGGTADVLTRIVAEQLSATYKQQFFVETRAGGGGTIGVKFVADSPPDGYNFALTNASLLVLHPLTNPKLGYDVKRDLTNIGLIAGSPLILVVNAEKGPKTLKEFIDQARTADKPPTYSSSGVGSSGHLFGENLAHLAKVKFEHVPYKGASQRLTDLAGGHINFSVQTVSSAAALVRGGTLRALAHTGKARLPDFPDIPTFKELGYDMVATLWFALAGPAHLPNDITTKVNAEINRAVRSPEVEARLRRDGLIADPMSVEEFNKFIDAEVAIWKPALERAGLLGKN